MKIYTMDDKVSDNKSTIELLRKSRFLVRFPFQVGIQEWWVHRFKKSQILFDEDALKTFTVTFREIDGNGDAVFYDKFRRFNELGSNLRTVVFEDLDSKGCALTREFFTNCVAKKIRFEECRYDNDEKKLCSVVFEYEDILDKMQ